ncbi:ABC transporter permease [Marinitenerispora sediminis]|uniref:Glycine/betaine ABC transporter n=1 Tax=Marinitenerispora sediminis TaxID=1931232 RepID=A0A368T4M8_9ACTN|nr:ABC transporter permease subunit [Marinitenerispora sediminis]RCV57584.1 glycine/betaine ABC transporter [Marinitenerispora sediminis]RCV58299.1 glycine/betaine ABC transporter [Marinitenerispora sediminis]RCV59669.1 glycine/betaine ABC transporter [Marinitenerispora sediminis]
MPRIPVGTAVESSLQWLVDHAGGFFDGVSAVLLFAVNTVYTALVSPLPFVLIAVFGLVAAVTTRSAVLTVFTVLAFLLVDGMRLWTQTLETLAVVIMAAVISVLVGVPVGILAANSARVSVCVRPVLDFMQTLPVFVYLVPSVFFFGIGVVPGIVATTVFAIPPAVRLTELGLRQVDAEIVEAARAFGPRPGQVLREVQLPLALPSIMAGVNQVIMLALSMVVVAGMVGAEGLGGVVVSGVTQFDIGLAFEGGIAVVVLAIFLDRVTGALGRPRSSGRRTRTALDTLLRRRAREEAPREPEHAAA